MGWCGFVVLLMRFLEMMMMMLTRVRLMTLMIMKVMMMMMLVACRAEVQPVRAHGRGRQEDPAAPRRGAPGTHGVREPGEELSVWRALPKQRKREPMRLRSCQVMHHHPLHRIQILVVLVRYEILSLGVLLAGQACHPVR
jgi:hypothetical protein